MLFLVLVCLEYEGGISFKFRWFLGVILRCCRVRVIDWGSNNLVVIWSKGGEGGRWSYLW